jgi:hypothetical protein
MGTEQRLAALEAENHDLRNRLAVLEGGRQPKKPAPPPDDEGVKISVMLPVAHPKHLPSDDEYRALLKIVTSRYPQLKFQNADDEFESFCASFQFICSLTKTAQPVTKFAASWWLDYGQQWCRDAGVQGLIRSFLPAIIATGDVQYCLESNSTYWLDPFRGSGRAVDASAWRKIMNGGDLLAPTALNVFVDHSIGHVRVQNVW